MRIHPICFALGLLATCASPALADADEPDATDAPSSQAAPSASSTPPRVAWREEWPQFRLIEGVGTGVLGAGVAGIEFGLGHPEEANWRGGILLDDAVRRGLEADSNRTGNAFGTASDVLTGTLIAYPFVVDAGVAAGAVHREGTTAVQLALLGAESFAVAGFAMAGLKHLVARERPPSEDCSAEGGRNLYCSQERFESFPSGHTTLAFTGASLVCTAHEHLDLYGGGVAERVACWSALGLASGSGLSRIVSGNHYLSDVAAGALIGVGSGYLLPKALHFGIGARGESRARLSPLVAGEYRGLVLSWQY